MKSYLVLFLLFVVALPSLRAGTTVSGGVISINGLGGVVTLSPGSNITFTTSGNTITINSSGGGGSGVTTFNTRNGAVTLLNTDVNALSGLTFNTTGSAGSLLNGSGGTLTTSGTGAIVLAGSSGTLNIGSGGTLGSNAFTSTAYAPLASPALTGTPTINGIAVATVNTAAGGDASGTIGALQINNASHLTNFPSVDQPAGLASSTLFPKNIQSSSVTHVFIDYDGNSDPDDLQSILALCAMMDNGECVIDGLANDVQESHGAPLGLYTIASAGHGNIPVGSYTGPTSYSGAGSSAGIAMASYLNGVGAGLSIGNTMNFNGLTNPEELSSSLYRRVFTKWAQNPSDKHVLLLQGALSALYTFYNSSADSISPFTGAQLMAQVNPLIVSEGGTNPSGTADYNYTLDSAAAGILNTLQTAGYTIYGIPDNMGYSAATNYALLAPPNSPLNIESGLATASGIYIYDPMVALLAVRGTNAVGVPYFNLTQGTQNINTANGNNTFTPGTASTNHWYYASYPTIADTVTQAGPAVFTSTNAPPIGTTIFTSGHSNAALNGTFSVATRPNTTNFTCYAIHTTTPITNSVAADAGVYGSAQFVDTAIQNLDLQASNPKSLAANTPVVQNFNTANGVTSTITDASTATGNIVTSSYLMTNFQGSSMITKYGTSSTSNLSLSWTPSTSSAVIQSGSSGASLFLTGTQVATSFPLTANGILNPNNTRTTVAGSTSGSAIFTEPVGGGSLRCVVIQLVSLVGTATYSFPTAFTYAPVTLTTSGPASSVVTSISTGSVTVTGATTSGTIILEGY